MNGSHKTSIYEGIVVANADPDRSGQVLVYIPTLDGTPFLEELKNKDEIIKKYTNLSEKDGLRDKKDIILQKSRWATVNLPVISSGSPTLYNARSGQVTSSEAETREKDTGFNTTEMPGALYERPENRLVAGHGPVNDKSDLESTGYGGVNTDPDNDKYYPELYTNSAKGWFSVPAVGALVRIIFPDDSTSHPIIIGYVQDYSALRRIFKADRSGFRGYHYPSGYENIEGAELEELYRNSTILTTGAGALTFCDTDKFKRINLSHYTGSFLEYKNNGFQSLVKGKSSTLITGDSFETVEGNLNVRVKKDYITVIDHSYDIKIGSRKYDLYKAAADALVERAAVLSEFEKQRTGGLRDDVFGIVEGAHKPLDSDKSKAKNRNIYSAGSGEIKNVSKIKSVRTLTPKEIKKNTDPADASHTASYNNLKSYGLKRPDGSFIGQSDSNREKFKKSQQPAWSESLTSYKEYSKKGEWDLRDDPKKSLSTAGGDYKDTPCTSIEDQKKIEKHVNDKIGDILKQDTTGGDFRQEVTRDYELHVGAANNHYPAVRVDPIGGLVMAGVAQGDTGVSNMYKSVPLVEHTGIGDNFPCGNYTIHCGNKFNVKANSGGISMKTSGIAEIAGVSTILSGKHLLQLTTSGNISMEAGKSLTISADILSLRQSKNKQLSLGGSVGVENNITVGGSAIINGEAYLQHVTAPAEIQTTDQNYQLRGWSRRESTDFAEPVAAIPEGRIVVKLTRDLCYKICRWGGVKIRHPRGDTNYEYTGGEPIQDVRLPAWNDEGVSYGVPPEYEYDEKLDEWVEKPGTGFANNRDVPFQTGARNNDVPLIGTNRITSYEMEIHAHQFKNLPLSLRATSEDVIMEARDIESYANVRGIPKGSRPAKVLVKKYKESNAHKEIMRHVRERSKEIDSNIQAANLSSGQGTGTEEDLA